MSSFARPLVQCPFGGPATAPTTVACHDRLALHVQTARLWPFCGGALLCVDGDARAAVAPLHDICTLSAWLCQMLLAVSRFTDLIPSSHAPELWWSWLNG